MKKVAIACHASMLSTLTDKMFEMRMENDIEIINQESINPDVKRLVNFETEEVKQYLRVSEFQKEIGLSHLPQRKKFNPNRIDKHLHSYKQVLTEVEHGYSGKWICDCGLELKN